MLRKWSLYFAVALALVCAGTVSAEIKTFSKMSVDVPSGWTAQEDGSVVALIAPDKSAAISIAMDSTQGMSGLDLAKVMSTHLNGSDPKADDGGFTFTFKNSQGVESTSILYAEGGEYVMFTITGKHPQIPGILDSIKEK